MLESIARTSLSPAKWIVAKRNPADAESGLMMVLDGKSVGLGDVDSALNIHPISLAIRPCDEMQRS